MPPQPTQPPATAQRTLRLINLITFPPAFIMLLLHGILRGGSFPALALIPLAISALLALYLLNPNAVTAGGSSITLAEGHVAVLDFALGVWLFVMCVCCWVEVPKNRYDGPQVMLGTYGSVWVMVNCAIHVYVAVLRLPEAIKMFATPDPERGQRRFRVENGYVRLGREGGLPVYQDGDRTPSTPASTSEQ
ncbi:uncharacterized protein LTR77_011160 [Saxophila tyrrhenica]|uniref:Uncharacterized protein n=1 Tax=Saxophila tyrrhenica TaxID=1690608 RepID=A0AAV9NVW5_9PEZI|nr:hypothetical protein LTR77_011160 [Saxophila tyrrhenica]